MFGPVPHDVLMLPTSLSIGPYTLPHPLGLAPMAGITDAPFRQVCQAWGAAWTVGEMISSDISLLKTQKTAQRIAGLQCLPLTLISADEPATSAPNIIQIAGTEPAQLAEAAQFYVDLGADIIDINMGCPAKKVCKVAAGSALMQDETRVEQILNAVCQAVKVPVTLKTRLGWDEAHCNVMTIARLAEQAGIAALAVHGRTRADAYRGQARYDLIALVKQQLHIPVIANGDVTSATKAQAVLQQTSADGLLVGRASQGQPWLFTQWRTPVHAVLNKANVLRTVDYHLQTAYDFYGPQRAVKIMRKHLQHYFKQLLGPDAQTAFRQISQLTDADQQYTTSLKLLQSLPDNLLDTMPDTQVSAGMAQAA